MHFYLRSSGIKPENYEAFTMERFKTDNIMAYEMKKLAQDFLKDPNAKGLGFFGRPGTGKTHICIATCQAMKREHHYWQYRREIQRIKAVMYKNLDRYDEMIARVSQLPWLYIDDLFKGAIKGNEMQSQDQQIMFDIINSRYVNRMPTIVSSEFPLDEITRADEGTGSRLKEMLEPYVYTVHGENRRLKGA
jgi:DNA replication protein DnaC